MGRRGIWWLLAGGGGVGFQDVGIIFSGGLCRVDGTSGGRVIYCE